MSAFSAIDRGASPPEVTFPARYNAAVDLVDQNLAAGRGARLAYVDDREQLTYAALAERVNRAGQALASLGVVPEQRVLMVMLDTVDFPAVFLGAMKLGAVPVPINTLLTPEDYAYMARNSRARVVVVESDARSSRSSAPRSPGRTLRRSSPRARRSAAIAARTRSSRT